MYINYTTQQVLKPTTVEVLESFTFQITVPVQVVRELVERHFNHIGNYGFVGFNKINAIKELRILGSVIPLGNTRCIGLGLREAKDIIEEVYREGQEAGNYHITYPEGWVNNLDDLPF